MAAKKKSDKAQRKAAKRKLAKGLTASPRKGFKFGK